MDIMKCEKNTWESLPSLSKTQKSNYKSSSGTQKRCRLSLCQEPGRVRISEDIFIYKNMNYMQLTTDLTGRVRRNRFDKLTNCCNNWPRLTLAGEGEQSVYSINLSIQSLQMGLVTLRPELRSTKKRPFIKNKKYKNVRYARFSLPFYEDELLHFLSCLSSHTTRVSKAFQSSVTISIE